MKRLTILALAIAFGCGPKEQEPIKAPTEIGDEIVPEVPDNADNSLDYIGTYKGVFPMYGQKPIEATLQLSEDFSYVLTQQQLSVKKAPKEINGTFRWSKSGDYIILSDTISAPYEFYVRGDTLLVRRDKNGKHTNGKQMYKLVKLRESEAIKADETPQEKLPPKITSIHWKLSEINGRLFKTEASKDYYIEFNDDGSFSAFAGCNKIRGRFESMYTDMRLFDIVSTMMACPEIKTEDQFKKALESADNFVSNEKVLQLRKGSVNLLKFDAFAIPKP